MKRSIQSFHVHGFTLVELLITIAIIGILSLMGLSTFMTTQKKGRDFQRKASLAALGKALESYMNDKGVYPPSIHGKILWCGTEALPESDACEWGVPFADPLPEDPDADNPFVYMKALPKDPAGNLNFRYEAVDIGGVNKGYRIYAHLENDQDPDVFTTTVMCGALACNFAVTSETVARPTPMP